MEINDGETNVNFYLHKFSIVQCMKEGLQNRRPVSGCGQKQCYGKLWDEPTQKELQILYHYTSEVSLMNRLCIMMYQAIEREGARMQKFKVMKT